MFVWNLLVQRDCDVHVYHGRRVKHASIAVVAQPESAACRRYWGERWRSNPPSDSQRWRGTADLSAVARPVLLKKMTIIYLIYSLRSFYEASSRSSIRGDCGKTGWTEFKGVNRSWEWVLTGESVLHDDIKEGSTKQWLVLLASERNTHCGQLTRHHRAPQGRRAERRECLSRQSKKKNITLFDLRRGIQLYYWEWVY